MIERYGKEIDLSKLKGNILRDLPEHVAKVKEMAQKLSDQYQLESQPNCYVCDKADRSIIAEILEFTYVQCKNCKHIYTTHRYSNEAIIDFYRKNEYYSQTTYANEETCFYRRDNVAKPKVEFIEEFVDGKGTWIDVGAGIGDLVSVLKEKGWNAIGLEISDSSVAFSRKIFDIELLNQTFEEFIGNNSEMKGGVEVISFIGVLEHVTNPMELLNLAHDFLSEDGIVVYQGPNGTSLSSQIQTVFPENVFRHMSPLEHIQLFTKESMHKMAELSGFEPVGMWFHGMDIYELLNNLVLLNQDVADSGFYQSIIANMNELQFVLDRKELSDRLIMVAKSIA